jgi:hypothetical protein
MEIRWENGWGGYKRIFSWERVLEIREKIKKIRSYPIRSPIVSPLSKAEIADFFISMIQVIDYQLFESLK